MDDLSAKLSELLNDPESMNRVRQMAEGLLGGSDEPEPPARGSSGLGDMLGADELQAVMSIVSRMKSSGDDSRTQLLYALRPHLSEERRERADTAIKILKLLDVLPLLKESGLLKL